jgi:hypothetical protein
MRWLLASALAIALAATSARPALARAERTLAYPRDRAWPAAVRFLVVDERLRVTDRDAEAGYALFELRDEGRTFRGALEVIPVEVSGRPAIRFVVTIEDRPSWVEIAMLNRLERKLRVELGSPSPARAPSAPGPAAPPRAPGEGAPPPARPDDGGPPISSTP